MNRWMGVGLAMVLGAGAVAWAEETADPGAYTGRVEDRSRVCMIDDAFQSQPGIPYTHDGKTYYLCCMGCVRRFESDPATLSRARDPLSGTLVDKAEAPVYVYKGQAYFFANETHLQAFAEHPDAYQPPQAQPADDAEPAAAPTQDP